MDSGSGYDPFKVNNGALTITATPDQTKYGYPGSWESGLISTENSFSQTYGYYEMRADLSKDPQSWSAFWMLPDNAAPNPGKLPGWQELDAVEQYGGYEPGVYSTIHTTDPAPNQNWQQNLQVFSNHPGQTDGYHTYGMDWEADKISFYVDGQLMGSQPTPSDMHGPMYMLADLAVTGGADPTGSPKSMSVDYIRAYSKDPNAVAVAQDAVSAPDGRDPGLEGAVAATASKPVTTSPAAATGVTSGTPAAPSTPPTGGAAPSSPVNLASATPAAAAAPTSIGSGPDTLTLAIDEDAFQGDALYQVTVDGKAVGGTQTAHAAHGSGATDAVTLAGNWGGGTHTVGIDFLNDLYHGTSDTDRNLYLEGATYDGTNVEGADLTFLSGGQQGFSVPASTTGGPVATTPTAPTTAAPVTTATGQGTTTETASAPTAATPVSAPPAGTASSLESLVLLISQDPSGGDARYTVSVDGAQVGGTREAVATHGSQGADKVVLQGDWAPGNHAVSVTQVGDPSGGQAPADRILYVNSASLDGTGVQHSNLTLHGAATQTFGFHV